MNKIHGKSKFELILLFGYVYRGELDIKHAMFIIKIYDVSQMLYYDVVGDGVII